MLLIYVSSFESQSYLQKNLPLPARQDESFSTTEKLLSSNFSKKDFRVSEISEVAIPGESQSIGLPACVNSIVPACSVTMPMRVIGIDPIGEGFCFEVNRSSKSSPPVNAKTWPGCVRPVMFSSTGTFSSSTDAPTPLASQEMFEIAQSVADVDHRGHEVPAPQRFSDVDPRHRSQLAPYQLPPLSSGTRITRSGLEQGETRGGPAENFR